MHHNVFLLTTLALILDRSDGSLGPPVHRCWKGIQTQILIPESRRKNSHGVCFESLVCVGCPELIIGDISELVDAEPELVILGIECFNELDVAFENLEPTCLLSGVLVHTAILSHPVLMLRHHQQVIIQLTSCNDCTTEADATEDGKKQSLVDGHLRLGTELQ